MCDESVRRRLAILEAKVAGKKHKCVDHPILCSECGGLICCRSYLCDKDGSQNHEIGYYPDTCTACFLEGVEKRKEELRSHYSKYKGIPFVGNIVYALLLYCNTEHLK